MQKKDWERVSSWRPSSAEQRKQGQGAGTWVVDGRSAGMPMRFEVGTPSPVKRSKSSAQLQKTSRPWSAEPQAYERISIASSVPMPLSAQPRQRIAPPPAPTKSAHNSPRAVQAEVHQQVEVVDDGGFRIGSGVAPVASVGGLASGLDPFS